MKVVDAATGVDTCSEINECLVRAFCATSRHAVHACTRAAIDKAASALSACKNAQA
jgi:hypothetical protein